MNWKNIGWKKPKIAFVAFYDEEDTEKVAIRFTQEFDRNNHPGLMVRKLDVLKDVIEDLTKYYNLALQLKSLNDWNERTISKVFDVMDIGEEIRNAEVSREQSKGKGRKGANANGPSRRASRS